ncbi:MAG: endolytic transglycosylase MltG [Lachnospiraceae bacterium]|nr:endolytic transglycosylase MltG [Lachnospiraceae bacterium]
MNLKSYARGIGAGLIVGAIVLGIGGKEKVKMTDSEIKARAYELGMIESQTLTELTSSVSEETAVSEEVKEPEVTINETNEQISESDVSENAVAEEIEFKEPDEVTVSPIIPDDEEPANSIDPIPDEETGFVKGDGSVSIQIVRGDSSVSVARRMFEAGLVESAVEFDHYLCQNGYDKVISVGNYEISFGMSFEEIANIITRR